LQKHHKPTVGESLNKRLNQEAKQKAILAEKYYKENKLRIEEIMKLIDVR